MHHFQRVGACVCASRERRRGEVRPQVWRVWRKRPRARPRGALERGAPERRWVLRSLLVGPASVRAKIWLMGS